MQKLDEVYVVYQRTESNDEKLGNFAVYVPMLATKDYELAGKHCDKFQELQDKGFFSNYAYSTYVIKTIKDVEIDGKYADILGYKTLIEEFDGKEDETLLKITGTFKTNYLEPDKTYGMFSK